MYLAIFSQNDQNCPRDYNDFFEFWFGLIWQKYAHFVFFFKFRTPTQGPFSYVKFVSIAK